MLATSPSLNAEPRDELTARADRLLVTGAELRRLGDAKVWQVREAAAVAAEVLARNNGRRLHTLEIRRLNLLALKARKELERRALAARPALFQQECA